MAVPTDFYYFVVSGFLLMLLPILFLGFFWLSGFLFAFIKVKASRGRKVMVRTWNVTHFLFRPGEIIDGWLIFKHKKNNYRVKVESEDFYRMLKLRFIDVDLENGIIFRRTGEGGTPYDPVTTDNLYVRALMAPKLEGKQMLIILILLIVVLLVVLAEGGMLFQMYKVVQGLAQVGEASVGVVS